MAEDGSFRDAFQNGRIEIYTGAQPATADAAVTGTLLCTITAAAAARTAEVRATGTVTLAGTAGSVDTLTVNGVDILGGSVAFNASLAQTALDVATAINAHKATTEYVASAAAAVVTIKALPGTGASPNLFVVVSGVTTLTKTDVNMASGVTAVNGLKFGAAASGVISKLAAQTWSGVNGVTGTAGYYRMYGSEADAGGLDSAATTIREDGAIATTAAELNMASTALTATATTAITAWQRILPTA